MRYQTCRQFRDTCSLDVYPLFRSRHQMHQRLIITQNKVDRHGGNPCIFWTHLRHTIPNPASFPRPCILHVQLLLSANPKPVGLSTSQRSSILYFSSRLQPQDMIISSYPSVWLRQSAWPAIVFLSVCIYQFFAFFRSAPFFFQKLPQRFRTNFTNFPILQSCM